MKKVFKYAKMILRPLLWLVYFLSGLFPRDEKIWVFGSLDGRRFADNPKYFFLDLILNEKPQDIKPIWITKSKKIFDYLYQQNLPVHHLFSLKGFYYCLRGKVWIYDHKSHDISFWLSNGALKVNFWHGIPLKKIEWDSKILKYYNLKGIKKFLVRIIAPWIYENSDYFLSPSEITDKIFPSAFRVKDYQLIKAGYPRVKVLLFPEKFRLKSKNNLLGKKLILYTPTFRDNSDEKLEEILKLDILDDFLLKHNLIMLIKLHPLSKLGGRHQNKSFKAISIIDPFEDVYQYLPFASLLITDYSSIYYDFLYLNRPIIFFPYDLKVYLSKNRDLYFDYMKYTPGPKVFNTKELMSEIEKILHYDSYSEARKSFVKKIGLRYNFIKASDIKNLIKL